LLGKVARVQKHDYRNDPLRLRQLGQIQAVMRKAVDREPGRFRFLLDHKQDRLAPPVRPLHQQRNVQFPKALADPFLQLLLAHRSHPRLRIDRPRFHGRKERNGLTRVVENEILEVLVVRHARGPSFLGGIRKSYRVRS
jgi:hypothetical protein